MKQGNIIPKVALAIAMSLLVTGCAVQPNQNSNFPEQEEIVEEPLVEVETVQDEFGTYQRDSKASVEFEWDRFDSTGLPQEEDKELKAWVINFIMTETLDSIALDNTAAWDRWAKDVAPKYLHSKHIDKLLNADAAVIMCDKKYADFKDGEDLIPTLFRDGSKRVSDKTIYESSIYRDTDTRGVFHVNVNGSMTSQAEDDKYLDWLFTNRDLYNGKAPDSYYEAWRSKPEYNDGNPQKINVSFNISYRIKKEGSYWKIVWCDNIFSE
jgi:hypothetical protein